MTRVRPGSIRSIALLGLALALVGCVSARATRYPYFLDPRAEAVRGAQHWALAPVALPDFLVGTAERVEVELCARIEAAGHACSRAGQLEPDARVFPELIAREVAVLPGGWVVWDGVKRRARVVREAGAPIGRYQMAGAIWVVSLHVRVLAGDGSRLFENQVGLEPLEEARVGASGYRKRMRAEALADAGVLREAVERALGPLLGG